MADPSPRPNPPADGGGAFAAIRRGAVLAVVLTLAIWVLFYEAALPLDAPSTAVVALVVILAVAGVQYLWSRLRPASR